MRVIITVDCNEEEMFTYLEDIVFPQFIEGYTAGHVSNSIFWNSEILGDGYLNV